jgi:hypothetical protein
MADQKEKASQTADVVGVMAECNRGNFLIECGRQLQELTDGIIRTGKKGKLTITLELIPAGICDGRINQFEITPMVTIKEPQPSQGSSIFFVSEDNHLTRDDPNQEQLDFEKEKETNGRR